METSAWPQIALVDVSSLGPASFPSIPLTTRWMNQQGPCRAAQKKMLQLCLYTHTLRTPTCPSACPTLTLQASRHPHPPCYSSCVLHSSSRVPEKWQKLRWSREPWSWFWLGAINEDDRHGTNRWAAQSTDGGVSGQRHGIELIIDSGPGWLTLTPWAHFYIYMRVSSLGMAC